MEDLPDAPAEELMPAPETDALETFNKEWSEKLKAKAAAEVEVANTMKTTADKDLTEWNKQRTIKLEARKTSNREAQTVFVETIENELASANDWERVTKLIDITQEGDSDKADVSRMRSLFVQLKNEPIKA